MNTSTSTNTREMDSNGTAHREGALTRAIEKQTSKIPSDVFLWAAGASMAASVAFEIAGWMRGTRSARRGASAAPMATFVGMWAPSFLLLGVYNKIVKVAGSDRMHK